MSLDPHGERVPVAVELASPQRPAPRSAMDRQAHSQVALKTEVIGATHPLREQTEAFIRDRYQQRFCARIEHSMPTLVRLCGADGRTCAALGLRAADFGPLFVEHYLDLPAERSTSLALTQAVARPTLVEVGNLAVDSGASGRQIIIAMTTLLATLGYQHVIFAATVQLRASLNRLGLRAAMLSQADPSRLGNQASHWGSYYQTQPQVLCGSIRSGIANLRQRGLL
ncbi:MAG: thermostable hemolysin [Xanthomonadales bacterium]|nr:thermostable hemolysin [Xanthomonadales bacterium]